MSPNRSTNGPFKVHVINGKASRLPTMMLEAPSNGSRQWYSLLYCTGRHRELVCYHSIGLSGDRCASYLRMPDSGDSAQLV